MEHRGRPFRGSVGACERKFRSTQISPRQSSFSLCFLRGRITHDRSILRRREATQCVQLKIPTRQLYVRPISENGWIRFNGISIFRRVLRRSELGKQARQKTSQSPSRTERQNLRSIRTAFTRLGIPSPSVLHGVSVVSGSALSVDFVGDYRVRSSRVHDARGIPRRLFFSFPFLTGSSNLRAARFYARDEFSGEEEEGGGSFYALSDS